MNRSTLVTNGAITSAQQLACLVGEVEQTPTIPIGTGTYSVRYWTLEKTTT